MGRFKLEEKDRLVTFWGSLRPEVLEKLGRRKCKEIAEEAVLKEYKKQMRS